MTRSERTCTGTVGSRTSTRRPRTSCSNLCRSSSCRLQPSPRPAPHSPGSAPCCSACTSCSSRRRRQRSTSSTRKGNVRLVSECPPPASSPLALSSLSYRSFLPGSHPPPRSSCCRAGGHRRSRCRAWCRGRRGGCRGTSRGHTIGRGRGRRADVRRRSSTALRHCRWRGR